MPSTEKILVLCERGRAGEAAIDVARRIAETSDRMLTVVGVVPQAPSGTRCGNSATDYNAVVAESVAADLRWARVRLGRSANSTIFVLLVEGVDETLEQFVRTRGFGQVVLPARRRPLRKPGHPAAARLSSVLGAEILIVDPASQRRREPRRAGAGGS